MGERFCQWEHVQKGINFLYFKISFHSFTGLFFFAGQHWSSTFKCWVTAKNKYIKNKVPYPSFKNEAFSTKPSNLSTV